SSHAEEVEGHNPRNTASTPLVRGSLSFGIAQLSVHSSGQPNPAASEGDSIVAFVSASHWRGVARKTGVWNLRGNGTRRDVCLDRTGARVSRERKSVVEGKRVDIGGGR